MVNFAWKLQFNVKNLNLHLKKFDNSPSPPKYLGGFYMVGRKNEFSPFK